MVRLSSLVFIVVGILAFPACADVLDAWCSQVKLPSSIAICSDPELRALTIERQHAFNAARARIGENRYPALSADQNAWVGSYPKACGLASDTPPTIPLPLEIRNCMADAGRKRISYLNSYGMSGSEKPTPSQPAAGEIGPSFDCSKATAPLARMICASPTLSRVDLRFAQAYWALRQQLSPDARRELEDEDLQFLSDVQLNCGISAAGLTDRSPDCVAAQYDDQRVRWNARLTGAAAEEAHRPLEQHLALQQGLRTLGFLPGSSKLTGAYDGATRAAVTAWQTARSRPATGLLGDDDARLLGAEIGGPSGAPSPAVTASLSAPSPAPAESPPSAWVVPSGQDEVGLKEIAGTYRVPVRINNALTLNFTLDSGAADVLIPADVMLTLIRTETLAPSDFIGKQSYRLADGSELPSMTFTLRELRVGNHRLENVRASVGPVAGGPLLGQSFLSRFKYWTLNNDRHVLVLVDH